MTGESLFQEADSAQPFQKKGRRSLSKYEDPSVIESLPSSDGTVADTSDTRPASYVDGFKPVSNPCSVSTQGLNASEFLCEEGELTPRVFVFHHLYIENNWRIILTDQIIKLIFSGLYDRATAVYSTISGPDEETRKEAVQMLQSFGSKFQVLKEKRSKSYERLTLHRIRNHVTDGDLIFYFHLKGTRSLHSHLSQSQPNRV